MFEQPEALPNLTLSKLCYLIHKLYLTNYLSFQELFNYGTHCLPLVSLNPTTYHSSDLTSKNFIVSLYPPNLSPFSKFFLCRGIVIGPITFCHHYILKISRISCIAHHLFDFCTVCQRNEKLLFYFLFNHVRLLHCLPEK